MSSTERTAGGTEVASAHLRGTGSAQTVSDIDSLATYFVTAHGRDLIALLAEVFEALQEGEDTSARIVDY